MDSSTGKNLLTKILILVLILNSAVMLHLLWQNNQLRNHKKDRHNKRGIALLLKEKLDLKDDQVAQIDAIRREFLKKEELLSVIIKAQRDSMNEIMFSDKCDTIVVKKLAWRVAENEYKMERYRINQAIQLQKILDSEQLSKLRTYVKDIRDYFKPLKKNR